MRISDWSSDVCSSDLPDRVADFIAIGKQRAARVLVPESRQEIIKVAGEKRRGVGRQPRRYIPVPDDGHAMPLHHFTGHPAFDIAPLPPRPIDAPPTGAPPCHLPVPPHPGTGAAWDPF